MGPNAHRALPLLALAPSLALGALCALIALSAAGCMEPLDPEHPISLELDSDFTAREVNTIRATTRCWNMDLGTQIVLNDGAAQQQVPVYPSDFTCDYGGGITHYHGGAEVSICNLTRRDAGVYQVMLHELGHVLNIKEHAEGDEAVMGTGLCISEVDRKMFFAANPGFTGQQGPDRTYRLAHDHNGLPRMTKLGDQVVVLWSDRDHTFPFQLLEAKSGRPTAVKGTLRPTGSAFATSWPTAFPAPGGFGVLWQENGSPRVGRVRLPSGKVEPERRLPFDGPVTAAAAGADKLYIATQDSPDKVSLRVVELAGGAWRVQQLASLEGALTARSVTYLEGQVYLMGLIPDNPRTVRVFAISAAGAVTASRDYTSRGPWPFLPWTAGGGGALYFANPMEDPLATSTLTKSNAVHLLRIDLAGGELGSAATAYVELPAEISQMDLPCIAYNDGKLWLAMNEGLISNGQDVVLSALDGETLQRVKSWHRVSPPDFCGAHEPAILGLDDRLLLVWGQDIDGPKSRVVLTR